MQWVRPSLFSNIHSLKTIRKITCKLSIRLAQRKNQNIKWYLSMDMIQIWCSEKNSGFNMRIKHCCMLSKSMVQKDGPLSLSSFPTALENSAESVGTTILTPILIKRIGRVRRNGFYICYFSFMEGNGPKWPRSWRKEPTTPSRIIGIRLWKKKWHFLMINFSEFYRTNKQSVWNIVQRRKNILLKKSN